MRVRRLPTMMAFQRLLATNTYYAGKLFQQHNRNACLSITKRRRRRHDVGLMSVDDSDTTSKVTQYTINDYVCPPTDPEILKKVVQKHIHTLPMYWFSRPVAKHTEEAFQEALDFVKHFGQKRKISFACKVNVILDSGCGTGRSTFILGEMYPNCVVIGVDQSIARLSRNKSYKQSNHPDNYENQNNDQRNTKDKIILSDHPYNQKNNENNQKDDNVLLLRAELTDFWKCCLSSNQWQENACIYKHYLLYPNPYPKKSRLKSRFYAHPAFPLLMMTLMMDDDDDADTSDGELLPTEEVKLVVRSNWYGYLNELKSAIDTWEDCGGTFTHWKKTFVANYNDKSSQEAAAAKIWCPTINKPPLKFQSSGPNRLDIFINKENLVPMTNFEAKYLECGESIYELTTTRVRRWRESPN